MPRKVIKIVFVLKNTKIIEITTTFAEEELGYVKSAISEGFKDLDGQLVIRDILNCVIDDHFYDNHNFGNGIFMIKPRDISSFYICVTDLEE